MVLVQDDGDLREHLHGGGDHVTNHDVAGVRPRAAARLQDDRRVDRVGRLHDGQHLLHVVDVECGHAVAVFGGVVQQLS